MNYSTGVNKRVNDSANTCFSISNNTAENMRTTPLVGCGREFRVPAHAFLRLAVKRA